MRWSYISVVTLFALGGLSIEGCAGVSDDGKTRESSDVGESKDPFGTPLAEVPRETRAVAEAHLLRVRGTDFAPNWSADAKLVDPPRRLYRPDVDGPAYYEFAVDQGGYVLVSTGEHDIPVPHFNDRGARITESLRLDAESRGETVTRFYRLDNLAYAAEDAREKLVANLGAHLLRVPGTSDETGRTDSRFHAFSELKRDYKETFAPYIASLRETASESWAGERSTLDPRPQEALRPQSDEYKKGNPDLNVTGAYWIPRADLLRDRIRFQQEEVNGCLSGCGPVAWGQLTVFMSYLAREGDVRHQSLEAWRLYSGAADSNFPFDNTARNLVWELHGALSTHCIGDASATTPMGMNDYDDWARGKGARLALDVELFWNHAAHAEKWLKSGEPVIVGTGALKHYAVAIAYGYVRQNDRTDKYIFVNQGWGGNGNGWIPLSVFYSAVAKPN